MKMSHRRLLAIALPYLPVERCAASSKAGSGIDNGPCAVFANQQGALRLTSVCARAAQAGLRIGLPLAEARARLPELAVWPQRVEADAALRRRLADQALRWSPSVACDEDGLRLDASGIAHLFGGEAALLAGIVRHFARQGLTARACVADTLGAAWAGAHLAPTACTVFAPGQTRADLAPLPIAALRLAPEDLAQLQRLGLRRIGDLYPIADAASGRAGLARRFGPVVAQRLFQALGAEAEPLVPDAAAPALRARLAFAEPVTAPEALARIVAKLTDDLCAQLAAAQLGARRLALVFHRVDGLPLRLALGTSRPTRMPSDMARLFAEKLGTLDPGFGVEIATLDAELAQSLTPSQRDMLPDGDPGFSTLGFSAGADLAPLVDRLANRLGAANIGRLAHAESHVPERAQVFMAALGAVPRHLSTAQAPAQPRPLRLLGYPEPIDVTAELPDAPPLLFRWRRQLHHVAAANGPERIASEWWLKADDIRDYYRLEDRQGRRFWVYREGLWGAGAARAPRWFLHGLFA
ncbi:MAG: Y-family DNA polymerase [Rhodospirillales bacterium]|jgi:protein ImuB